jgi:hypothetical protein
MNSFMTKKNTATKQHYNYLASREIWDGIVSKGSFFAWKLFVISKELMSRRKFRCACHPHGSLCKL